MLKAIIFDLNGIFLQWKGGWFRGQDISERMFEIARSLRARGLKVFILSNNVGEALLHRKRYGIIRDSFDKVYYGWQTGYHKPNPGAWLHILEENDLRPEECIYFDDQMHNVVAAQKAGIRSFLFTDEDELEKILNEHIK